MDHPALHRQPQKSESELLPRPLKGLRRREVKAGTKLVVCFEEGKAVQIDFVAEIHGQTSE